MEPTYFCPLHWQAGSLPLAQTVKNACNAGDPGSIPEWGRSLGEGSGYPLQYSCLENSMDRGAWGLQPMGSQTIPQDRATNTFTFFSVIWGVTQSCLTLCDPMDYSLPGSSIHGIFHAKILEWVAISFSKRSSQPRDWTQVSHIVVRRFTVWATGEVP